MKKDFFIKFFSGILFGTIIFVSGFLLGKSERVIINPTEELDLTLFSEAYYLLEENFPGFEEIPQEKMVYGIINGLIGSLEDPHTAFFDPERSKVFMEDVSGKFDGIGIEIGIRNGNLQVISPLKNTPAYHAGIKAQDVITSINGESTEEVSLDEAVVKIRGTKGEEVLLGILRDEEEKEISIIRDTILIPSMEWKLIEGDIAHIELFHFHEDVSYDFAKMAREILSSPAKKIILDLRNNPGGLFSPSINIAGRFLEPNSVVVIQTGSKKKNGDEEIRSTGNPPFFLDYPLVVLINEGTASASEIIAGALKDQRSTPIIGTPSFGKGSIQRMHELYDGSTIKITEEYFLTPNKNVINNKGIKPDIEIEITEEDIENEKDPQLKEAVEVIKKM